MRIIGVKAWSVSIWTMVVFAYVSALNAGAAAALGGKVSGDLIRNGDFETGTLAGWQVDGVVQAEAKVRHAGRFAAVIVCRAEDGRRQWRGLRQTVAVRPGAAYRLALWSKQRNAAGAHVKVRWLDYRGRALRTHWVRRGVDGDHDWERIVSDMRAPRNAVKAELVVWCYFPPTGESRIWIDDVQWVSTAMTHVSPAAAAQMIRNGAKPRVLFAGETRFPIIDPQYAQKLDALGYTADACTLDELDPQTLEHCNAVVFTQFRVGRKRIGSVEFGPAFAKPLAQWVRNGGGVLFVAGLMGYGDHDELARRINTLLEPFGASILREQVRDERNKAVYADVLSYTYYSTRNFGKSPLTSGLRTLWYPGRGGQHTAPLATCTMRLGDGWQVLVRGEKTASSKTIPSEPPLVAVREFGRGRVGLATVDPRYFINDGYHPAYGGYALEKGDGFKLLARLYDWLGEPSMRAGWVYVERIRAPIVAKGPRKPRYVPRPGVSLAELQKRVGTMQWNSMRTFTGVIGVHTELSDGRGSVEAFCAAARELGYDFVAFAESMSQMSEDKWRALVAACKAASDAKFLAIPGLEIRDGFGVRVVFNLSRFPRPDELGERRWARLLFNPNWPTVIVAEPTRNALSPWQLRFYTGLALLTYDRGKLIDDARAVYRELAACDYRLIPVVVNRVYSVEQLRATQQQAITHVHARALRDLVAHSDWKHAGPLRTFYGCGSSYVSSGIMLRRFGVVTALGERMFAGAYRSQASHKELVRLALESQSPIAEVNVYRGTQLYRRFEPNARSFATDVVDVSTRSDTPWTVEARDADGRMLHSNALRKPTACRFNYTLCVDKQNSIITLAGFGMTAGWISGVDVGAIFPMLPAHEIVPAGEDASWCPVNSWEVRPEFGVTKKEFARLTGRALRFGGWERSRLTRRCRLSGDDCIVAEDKYDQPFVRATVRTIYFRPEVGSLNALVVEHDVQVLKDVALPHGRRGVRLFRIQTNTAMNPYARFALARRGTLATRGEFAEPSDKGDRVMLSASLERGDGAMLYPSPAGSIGVFSLADEPLSLRVGTTTNRLHAFVSGSSRWRNFVEIGVRPDSNVVRAGTRFHTRLLFVLDNRKGATPESMLSFLRSSGIGGPRPQGIEVVEGELMSAGYPLRIQARENHVRIKVVSARPGEPLPVVVQGLNANWDAGVVDLVQRKLARRVPVADGTAYFLLGVAQPRDIVVGNLLRADNPNVRLTVLEFGAKRLRFIVHNPLERSVTTRVSVPASLRAVVKFAETFTLAPGATLFSAEGGKHR